MGAFDSAPLWGVFLFEICFTLMVLYVRRRCLASSSCLIRLDLIRFDPLSKGKHEITFPPLDNKQYVPRHLPPMEVVLALDFWNSHPYSRHLMQVTLKAHDFVTAVSIGTRNKPLCIFVPSRYDVLDCQLE